MDSAHHLEILIPQMTGLGEEEPALEQQAGVLRGESQDRQRDGLQLARSRRY